MMTLTRTVFTFFAVLGAGLAPATLALADSWRVDSTQSRLGFEVNRAEYGLLEGVFTDWSADIEFDPKAPEKAAISVLIKTLSASTGNRRVDRALRVPDWFNTKKFAQAEFMSETVSHGDGDVYTAEGVLTICGVSLPTVLTFTLDIEGDVAKAKGTATVNRLDYKLGAGMGVDTIDNAVTVTVDLTASR